MRTFRGAPGHRAALVFFIVMLVAYLAVAVIFSSQAPERMPSHFNAAGDADDWSSKGWTLAIMSLGVGLPIVLNVPYKDYWIDDGQRMQRTEVVVVVTFMRLVTGLAYGLMAPFLRLCSSTPGPLVPHKPHPVGYFPSAPQRSWSEPGCALSNFSVILNRANHGPVSKLPTNEVAPMAADTIRSSFLRHVC